MLASSLSRLLDSAGSVLGGALREGLRGVQRVVVVLQPGPLGGRLERWEAARQETAERQVQAAVERFQALQRSQPSSSSH
ncbi:hypothetical protein CHLRE_04g228925v5 [Chlamydomonas reinhardtii]|uniref:Uncharacterized protein n=1 Tax=Chlamydomonas reinhardtii TaxID=3055 RepID=A0A2K3DUW1_CHLRE|nr:uncharacterized protein CHLRE_04g228925v5 [Chlamydomonas reinhardtii]PNW84302.1 hypothetical protein CHLRE_04g228925v5 [Chlamydomonas reinhardtii]